MILTYYPGCSLKTSSKFYDASIKRVFSSYGVQMDELDDWSCCGASAAHTIDDKLAHALVARNLSIAEKKGNPLFAPCSACYNRAKTTNETLRIDRSLREEINGVISPLNCLGTVEVLNIIEIFKDFIGLERLTEKLRYDLSSLKVVPYYGCVLTRITKFMPFDDREDPKSMDMVLWISGVETIKWPYKMECCGASKTLTDKDLTFELSSRIMDMAFTLGADAIVTPCPLCQLNLDILPSLGKKERVLPILFLSEVFELAIFGNLSGTSSHMIPVDGVTGKIGKKHSP
ncbi:MAG: CoB--CoM heterodisulfide reductase iron-sulfur subunit B family protein [Syntrophorhabdaceae bacterium]|nr:CoB--CoM heterodisulfide reductase iron-sulfur subunit B family protein [Syntrophorhabdaceae bacterium]